MSILLKNNFERIKHHKSVLFIACIVIPIFICAAIYISNHSTSHEVIAILNSDIPADLES